MLQTKECKQLVHESAKKLAEVIAKEEVPGQKFQSAGARQEKIQHELERHVRVVEKKINEGLQACILALDACQNPLMSISEVVRELLKCMDVISTPEALSTLGQVLLSGTSWKNHLGISDNCMETLYQGAKCLFDKKDYEQSEKAFFVLCSLEPAQFSHWVGLGHSCFQNKHYEQSINAYSMASILDPHDTWPHVWAANTFEAQKDFAHARMALDEALKLENAKAEKNHNLIRSLEKRVQNIKTR
jgi:tetratricopeptide (TPR) repeat protein